MRGKIVNLCIGFMNIMFGILIIIFTIYIPQSETLLTIQENYVVHNILISIYILLGCTTLLNIIQYFNHKKIPTFNIAYIFGILTICFIFIKEPAVALFPLISGILIILKSLRENLVEIDSTSAISVAIVLITAIVIVCVICIFYKSLAQNIKNKENKNELAYNTEYFRYVTELNEDLYQNPFINIKKAGKYGYINQYGEVVIDFAYDYASPFVKITMYNKDFYIALVCKNGSSYIILKNQREVLSYRTESADENYFAKMEELENIYKNTLGQGGKMQTEVPRITDNIYGAPAYEEISLEYTYRYDYNGEYDVLVTQSSLGLGDKYELAKKDDLKIKQSLKADNLAYDEKYLYLFSNGDIPFYETSQGKQGWFTSYGVRKTMEGNAQILEFIDDKILIRNYNKRDTPFFPSVYFINSEGNMLSEAYKEIYIVQDKYIVKNADNKYIVIDKEFNKIFNTEFDFIDPYLAIIGIYIGGNIDEEIEFNNYGYAKMNWKIVAENGAVITEDVEQIYGSYYEISGDKSSSYETKYNEFLNNLKKLTYNFVGDKFYLNYK